MSHCENPTQPHRVCAVSVVSFQRTGLSNWTDGVSNQVRSTIRLLDSAIEISVRQNGSCVSPIFLRAREKFGYNLLPSRRQTRPLHPPAGNPTIPSFTFQEKNREQ